MTKTEESKYWHKTERRKFQDELRHLRTRQGRFDAAMLHLDHPIPGTDLYLDPSDRGETAAVPRRVRRGHRPRPTGQFHSPL